MAKKKRRGSSAKRVAIVAKGPGRMLAPPVGHGWDVWGSNNVALGQDVDMIFDMHFLDWTMEENIANYQHLADQLSPEEIEQRAILRDQGFKQIKQLAIDKNIPIMSIARYAGVPGLVYPLTQIVDKFDCDLFPAVVPYMIAYAIYKRYTHIDLFGVNCLAHEEWMFQRDAVTGWLMFAKGKGIKVTVNGMMGRPLRLLGGYLYGYNQPQRPRGIATTEEWKIPKDQLNPDINDVEVHQYEVFKEV